MREQQPEVDMSAKDTAGKIALLSESADLVRLYKSLGGGWSPDARPVETTTR